MQKGRQFPAGGLGEIDAFNLQNATTVQNYLRKAYWKFTANDAGTVTE